MRAATIRGAASVGVLTVVLVGSSSHPDSAAAGRGAAPVPGPRYGDEATRATFVGSVMNKDTMKPRGRRVTRREFVSGAVAAAGVWTGAPALLRGRRLNDKLDIAFIACGGRALDNLKELTLMPGRQAAEGPGAAPPPDENVLVLCHVDQVALDAASQPFPKAKTFNDLRRVFDRP